jgi:hypothetical protein
VCSLSRFSVRLWEPGFRTVALEDVMEPAFRTVAQYAFITKRMFFRGAAFFTKTHFFMF